MNINKLTKKISIVILFLLIGANILFAQNSSVGINTYTPNPNAVLELISPDNNQGLLIPKMATAQREALNFGANESGMLVYDTDTGGFYFWATNQWISLISPTVVNTDEQKIDHFQLIGTTLELSLENDAEGLKSVDLSTLQDGYEPNTDQQTIDELSLLGNQLSISLSGDGEAPKTIDLSAAIEDADADATNEIQDLQYAGGVLSLTNDPANTTIDFSTWDQDASDDFNGDYTALINQPTIPTAVSELTNDSGFITSPIDSDADATNEIQDLQYAGGVLSLTNDPANTTINFSTWDQDASDDFNGDYTTLINQPTIPTAVSELTNDSGFITSPIDSDADATNEIQDLQYAGGVLSLTNDPANTTIDFSTWDQDASDDFNGDYTTLINQPTIPTAVSELINDTGFITSPIDSDADATNEIQDLQYAGGVLSLTNDPANTTIDFSTWDQDASDDFNGDYTTLINQPTIPTAVSELTNDTGFITSPIDSDADATNEIQDLQYAGGVLSLTNDPANTTINFSTWDQDASDDFNGDYTTLINQPTIPTAVSELTNDSGFITSPVDGDADATNELQDLQYAGGVLSLTNDPANTTIDFSTWDQDASDDFNGDYTALINQPTIPTAVSELTNDTGFITSPIDSDADATNEIQDLQYAGGVLSLTNDPANTTIDFSTWDQDASDDFNGDYTTLINQPTIPTAVSELTNDTGFITSPIDSDADATNEIQDLQYAGGVLSLTNDPANTTINFSTWDQDASDDFNGDYTALINQPTIPTAVSELTNDAGFITSPVDGDADATNEIELPVQTGQNGNYLTTNGSNPSWQSLGSLALLNEIGSTEITDNSIGSADLNTAIAGEGLTGGGGSPLALDLATGSGLDFSTSQLQVADVITPDTYLIVVGGTITYNSKGQITSTGTSDIRLKKDTVRIANVLDRVKRTNGYTYYWRDQNMPLKQYGFVAQQLEQSFPELVNQNENGTKYVNYQGLIPILIEAVKEQQLLIEGLQDRLVDENLKNKVLNEKTQLLERNFEQLSTEMSAVKAALGLVE